MLTEQFAVEVPDVISVAVRPGVVGTEMVGKILSEGISYCLFFPE